MMRHHVIPLRNIKVLYQATRGHENSFPMSIANPKGYPVDQESYSLIIPSSKLKVAISDEEILARFTKGFFGGWSFTLERWFFCLTRLSLLKSTGLLQL